MKTPAHIIVYEVTCPHCGGTHYLYGWNPRGCPHCLADLAGRSMIALRARENYYVPELNPLTGHLYFLPEWES
jgi:hypothetical protein